jgi:hypothetical protein
MYKFTNFPEKCKFHEKRQWKKIFNWKFRNFQEISYWPKTVVNIPSKNGRV